MNHLILYSFLFILFLVPIILVAFRLWYNSPDQKGKRGEQRVHDILSNLPEEYHILDDVILKTKNGTTQIDHIVVSKYGIFTIETKNYRGEIYGDDNRQQWTQIIITNVKYQKKWWKTYTHVTKNHFYNPVKQSLFHLYEIKKNLSAWPNLKIIPIVVFTGNADISHVESNNHVVNNYNLIATIQTYRTTYLSDSDVQNVVSHLSAMNLRKSIDNKTHVSNVKAAQIAQAHKVKSGICPKCGGHIVLRNGKYGNFYGCSNYPNCNFTTH